MLGIALYVQPEVTAVVVPSENELEYSGPAHP